MNTYRLQIVRGKDRLWYFHLRAPNGRIAMASEGYAKESNARRACLRLAIIFESHAVVLPVANGTA